MISNRDVESLRAFDLWLDHVDTRETVPLFDSTPRDYAAPAVQDTDFKTLPSFYALYLKGGQIDAMDQLDAQTILKFLQWLQGRESLVELYRAIVLLLQANDLVADEQQLMAGLLDLLPAIPFAAHVLFSSGKWHRHREVLMDEADALAPMLLRDVVLCASEYGHAIVKPFRAVMEQIRILRTQDLADAVELIALSVKSVDLALTLLLECLQPNTARLMIGKPRIIEQFSKLLFALALEHIEESSQTSFESNMLVSMTHKGHSDGFTVVDVPIRIDAPQHLFVRTGDHVRFSAASPPSNVPSATPVEIDGLVQRVEMGLVTVRCMQKLPLYFDQCSWHIHDCGSFVSTKSMLDALVAFYGEKEGCCRLFESIANTGPVSSMKPVQIQEVIEVEKLNESQNKAINAAVRTPLCLLWGPPGTGKTSTIVELLRVLLGSDACKGKRFLVAAPTHNAVDNVLRRFVSLDVVQTASVEVLRISTDVYKVANDLKAFTCDAWVGKDINMNQEARRKAQKRVKSCKIAFTTCTGANLGLLRNENFEVVIVDEASQQTEPMTLIPLVKGCEKLIMVGDHVQLRATTQQHSKALDYDISLFERLYLATDRPGVVKVMLDQQYRMHQSICEFASNEFYSGKLKTAVLDKDRPLPVSSIQWRSRILFAPCDTPEDLGSKSKQNAGQASLCKELCQKLLASSYPGTRPSCSIVILTPYTRQLQLLKTMVPEVEVSSIDGFQGREADIIVYVTVRCNQQRELGFLKDMRRLNVAVTRAKVGMIIIGNKDTLVGSRDDASAAVWNRLLERTSVVMLEKAEARS